MTVDVHDPFGAARDPALPTIALALDPSEAQRQLGRRLPRLTGQDGSAQLRAIRVTRHKPGKRCLIEYDVAVERPDGPTESVTLVGKVHFGRYGKSGLRLLTTLWEAGFDAQCADGISVPEPIGSIGRFRMWLQRKVPGVRATDLLPGPGGVALARRIADAAHKVHQAHVPTPARHTIADELRILRDCFAVVAREQPRLARQLLSLMVRCELLATETPRVAAAGIHRDFYADQVLVDGDRLYLLDFDLYCEGEAALDIGNFVGHVTEQSLRTMGRADALADREDALVDRFCELAGEDARGTVTTYSLLTLARHVYLSTRFEERRAFTGRLVDLCEERLGAGLAARRGAA